MHYTERLYVVLHVALRLAGSSLLQITNSKLLLGVSYPCHRGQVFAHVSIAFEIYSNQYSMKLGKSLVFVRVFFFGGGGVVVE